MIPAKRKGHVSWESKHAHLGALGAEMKAGTGQPKALADEFVLAGVS